MSHQPNPDSSGEIAWPPYDMVSAPIEMPDFWSELSDVEKQRLRELTDQMDAATGSRPGTALFAIIATVNTNRTLRL